MWREVSLWNSLPQKVRKSNITTRLNTMLDNFRPIITFVAMTVGVVSDSVLNMH